MIMKRRKKQKQLLIKYRAKIHTEALEFALKVGLYLLVVLTKKENIIKSSQKTSFSSKLIKGGS